MHDQAEVKADFWAIFDVGDAEPGDEAVAVAQRQAAAFAAKWQARYPAAVACVTDDLASLTVHLRFPAEHWRRIRHSNFIERTFGETRRRTKVIGRLPGETHLPVAGVGGAGPGQPRLARPDHDPQGAAAAARPAPPTPPSAHSRGGDRPGRHDRRITSPWRACAPTRLHRSWDATEQKMRRLPLGN